MPREKRIRKLYFKPQYKEFIPVSTEPNGVTNLLDEEIEAIYLMDILEMYQEEAAKNMEVSRPTFTRILKNARKKLSIAIISGHKIKIESKNNNSIIAICSDDENFLDIANNKKNIFIYSFSNHNYQLIKKIENPVYFNQEKPAVSLPLIFIQNNVNIFISSKIGEGLKYSLISKGMKPLEKSTFRLDELSSIVE